MLMFFYAGPHSTSFYFLIHKRSTSCGLCKRIHSVVSSLNSGSSRLYAALCVCQERGSLRSCTPSPPPRSATPSLGRAATET